MIKIVTSQFKLIYYTITLFRYDCTLSPGIYQASLRVRQRIYVLLISIFLQNKEI